MVRFLSTLQAFYDELRRRHVFRVAGAYVVGGFFVLEAANLVFQGLLVPAWVYRALTVLILIGFPITLVLSWLFQWTPAGIRREAETAPAVAQPAGAGALTEAKPVPVRAFAFVGLGIVIALVVMGLSVPYMYANRQGVTTERTPRDGVQLASNEATMQRLAVLPFISLTGDGDAGFADGLAEDITAAIAQLGRVDVVSRTTSESYRNSEKTAREIGTELGVGLILEGTVRRAGTQVRVTVQLIDARTDRHLWANSYDRVVDDDVFRMQSELAQEIVAAIQSVVIPEQTDDMERRLLAQRAADEGAELLSRVHPAYDEAAEDLFAQSLEVDSGNPVAHAGIAQTLLSRAQAGGPAALVDSAEHHAELAVELDPDLPDAYAAQAFVFMVKGELDSMQVALTHALELDEGGSGFVEQIQERIRLISPEALEVARRAFAETSAAPAPADAPQIGRAPSSTAVGD